MAKVYYGKHPNASQGYEYPFCKNTRLMVKTRCKGISFKLKLPTESQIKLANDYSNHTVYIGYNGKSATDHLEVGLSYRPNTDKGKGYTWMWNYTSDKDVPGDNGRGTTYYPLGSEVFVQLYLDGSDMKLRLKINGQLVWTSPRTHTWSEYTTPDKHLGTRIISSIEQSGWSSMIPHFQSRVDEIRVSDIQLFTANGWTSTTVNDVKWGFDDTQQGIEITLDEKYKNVPQGELGQFPTVSPGFGSVANNFVCKYPL